MMARLHILGNVKLHIGAKRTYFGCIQFTAMETK